MKKAIPLIFTILLAQGIAIKVFSETKLDSLLSLVNRSEPELPSSIYNEIALNYLEDKQFELGRTYADSAILLAGIFKDKKMEASALHTLGKISLEEGSDSAAIVLFLKSQNLYENVRSIH